MIKAIVFSIIMLSVFGPSFDVYCKDMPNHWPWRGVTVDNLTFNPNELETLKDRLKLLSAIRITLRPRSTAKMRHLSPEIAWAKNLKWADKMLDECRKLNIVGIISVHEFPIDPSLGITQSSKEFWNSAKLLNNVVERVDKLASHFSSRGEELAGFEVLSEPFVAVNNYPRKPKEWPNLLLRIVQTIRKHSDKWIVVTPGPAGLPRGYEKFTPLNDSRIVYGAHMYEPNRYTMQGIKGRRLGYSYPGLVGLTYWNDAKLIQAFEPLKKFQDLYSVPIWIGEFSAARWARGSQRYLGDIVNYCDKNNWGWAYFNIGGFNAWDPNFNSEYPLKSNLAKEKVGIKSNRWKFLLKYLSQ